mgnify:CR=1 FL=1
MFLDGRKRMKAFPFNLNIAYQTLKLYEIFEKLSVRSFSSIPLRINLTYSSSIFLRENNESKHISLAFTVFSLCQLIIIIETMAHHETDKPENESTMNQNKNSSRNILIL